MLRLYRKTHSWIVDAGVGTQQYTFGCVEFESPGVTVTVTPPECADTPDTLKSWLQFDSALLIFSMGKWDRATIVQKQEVYISPDQSQLRF